MATSKIIYNSRTSGIIYKSRTVKIKSKLPFRVKFMSVKVPGYSANTPAPVGIAVIGYSNYIL